MDEKTLREAARILARRAGQQRKFLAGLTPDELRAHQRAAAKARWAGMGPRQQKAHIRKMLAARGKRKA